MKSPGVSVCVFPPPSYALGVLAHAAALEALSSPTVPCYCRHGRLAAVLDPEGFLIFRHSLDKHHGYPWVTYSKI